MLTVGQDPAELSRVRLLTLLLVLHMRWGRLWAAEIERFLDLPSRNRAVRRKRLAVVPVPALRSCCRGRPGSVALDVAAVLLVACFNAVVTMLILAHVVLLLPPAPACCGARGGVQHPVKASRGGQDGGGPAAPGSPSGGGRAMASCGDASSRGIAAATAIRAGSPGAAGSSRTAAPSGRTRPPLLLQARCQLRLLAHHLAERCGWQAGGERSRGLLRLHQRRRRRAQLHRLSRQRVRAVPVQQGGHVADKGAVAAVVIAPPVGEHGRGDALLLRLVGRRVEAARHSTSLLRSPSLLLLLQLVANVLGVGRATAADTLPVGMLVTVLTTPRPSSFHNSGCYVIASVRY